MRSNSTRRPAATRVIVAPPCAPSSSPACATSLATKLSSGPSPLREMSIGGRSGNCANRAISPPAGSWADRASETRFGLGEIATSRFTAPGASVRRADNDALAPLLEAPASAEPVKVSVAGSPNTGAASAKVSSWNAPRRNLTGRSGAMSSPAFLAGAGAAGFVAAAGAGMGRRSTSTRPMATLSMSTRSEASGRRDQSIST